MRYLALRPWRGEALVGQMVTRNSTSYTAYVATLAADPVWGRWPAILGLAVEDLSSPLVIAASVDHAIGYANAGGIVQIKWSMWNPWTGGNMNDRANVDIPGLLNPAGPAAPGNTAAQNATARARLDSWIATVRAELIRFRNATGGAPMLFRPLSEMNGDWFWFGHEKRADYIALWNYVRDQLLMDTLTEDGLHNLIWVYESDSFAHLHDTGTSTATATASDYYYPGDDRVDVMAHNLYDNDWVLPWDANKVYSRYPKIYGIPQAGPGKTLPSARDGSFDNTIYITQIAARYPRASFFIVWDSFYSHDNDDGDNDPNDIADDDGVPGTDTTTYKHLSIIDNLNPDDLMTAARVITRDELRWRAPANPAASTVSSTALAATWSDISAAGQNESGFRLEIAPNQIGPWSIAASPAADATTATATGLPAASTRWLRVRSLFSNGDDSLPTDPVSALTWSLFQQWKNDTLGNFAAPDLADDDHDGLVSLLEYSLGADPLANSQAQQPTRNIVNLTGTDYLTLTFRRRPGASGVSYFVESTGDLLTGPWLTQSVQLGAPADNGDGTETVTYRDTLPMNTAASRFLRLRVSTP